MTTEELETVLDVVDLFAGPGGWEEGFRLSYPDLITEGVEHDEDACETARAAGYRRVCGDVREVPMSRYVGVRMHAGSPPCQGFSSAGLGKGREDALHLLEALRAGTISVDEIDAFIAALAPKMTDERTLLALEPWRWAMNLRPEYIAWEQVPPVLVLWEALAVQLRAAGYEVVTGIVHAEQFGVPQTRKRAVLLARLPSDEDVVPLALPVPTHSRYHSRSRTRLDPGVKKWVSMAEALDWGMTDRPYLTVVVGTASGGTDPQAIGGSGARALIRREIDEGRWIQRSNYSKAGKPGQTSLERGRTTRELHEPSVTMTSKGGQWAVESEDPSLPPLVANRISYQDAGIIQSFPADYPWSGKLMGSRYQQVGNAIPPLLAAALIQAVRRD